MCCWLIASMYGNIATVTFTEFLLLYTLHWPMVSIGFKYWNPQYNLFWLFLQTAMSVTTSNFQHSTLKWREKGDPSNLLLTNTEPDNISSTVDDGLTSLSWLQNLNMCMTRLGAPTPPTPPASPVCFGLNYQSLSNRKMSSTPSLPASSGNKCKGAVPSSGNVERANNCKQASASCTRSGYNTRVQSESQAQSTSSQKSESSKKKGSSSQSKPPSSKQNKKGMPQYSPIQPPPCHDVVDYKSNGNIKPPYSYATLICMAMKANRNKMTLSSIYKWIKENFLYYRNAEPSWQVWLIEQPY